MFEVLPLLRVAMSAGGPWRSAVFLAILMVLIGPLQMNGEILAKQPISEELEDEIEEWVENLAKRIAGFPAPAVRLAKSAVLASEGPIEDGLREEAYLFAQLLRTPEAQSKMKQFLDLGGQTRDGELQVGQLSGKMRVESGKEV